MAIWLLEQRQSKNNSILSKIIPILKLTALFAIPNMWWKSVGIIFDWMELFLYCLGSSRTAFWLSIVYSYSPAFLYKRKSSSERCFKRYQWLLSCKKSKEIEIFWKLQALLVYTLQAFLGLSVYAYLMLCYRQSSEVLGERGCRFFCQIACKVTSGWVKNWID